MAGGVSFSAEEVKKGKGPGRIFFTRDRPDPRKKAEDDRKENKAPLPKVEEK